MTIELRSLKKIYANGEEVLTEISATIETGQFYILVGASGSGKSTILNAIAGFIPINSGKVLINGHDMTNKKPADRHLAMVFQNYALIPNLTVAENIVFGLSARHVPKNIQQEKLRSALTLVGLVEQQAKYPRFLSGGQRQRVSLARALVSDADIILMDEPLSNLDAKLRAEMRKEIRAIQQKLGLTVVYVTHDQTEAMTMGDQIMLLNNGKIEQIGRPLDLYNAPATTFVADFFGNPAINLLRVRLAHQTLCLDNGYPLCQLSVVDDQTEQVTILGIRPENIQVTLETVTNGGGLSGTVEQIEPLGDGTNLVVVLDSKERLRIKVHQQLGLAVSDSVMIRLNLNNMLFFDQNGTRMLLPNLVESVG
ncbi:ABC transporter ATP-binding protein [Weissella diestrammenae]|uniref:ABC transporter ATP-binding protein n=1 Tax=Weissella diestrammenae TaxID=1162633 RepID=A0A7G9T566_9LACO|nr:ABC transporter ATP-binding protein [Weissella diestrammenae]MCM0583097.1 ABC transporter ATP-binding protein [Weissella diestrammenae]QNN75241.1 ABC transporter ATP-binding protein [Weissella diestrammenae]